MTDNVDRLCRDIGCECPSCDPAALARWFERVEQETKEVVESYLRKQATK